MATECPTGNHNYLNDLEIRLWLRDNDPSANLLLNDLEFTPEEVRMSRTLAVDKWNETPPFIANYDVNNFPYRYNLLMGTVANLLFIAANRYRRNDLSYQIAGGAVNDQAKWQPYDAAGEALWTKYSTWVAASKRAINMEQGWGIIDGGMTFIR